MGTCHMDGQLSFRGWADERLCALAAAGNKDAEEALVVRHLRLVRICVRPYFLTGGDREDLIQEGMLELLKAIRNFSPEKNVAFRTYAELCIRHKVISAIRMAVGKKHIPLNSCVSLEPSLFEDYRENAPFGATLSRQENPEDVIINKEKLAGLLNLIDGQLTKLEHCILGYYLNGLSYSEIAKEVDRSTKSVDNAVQRVRRKLARQMKSSEYSES